jgi:hypothetical protein
VPAFPKARAPAARSSRHARQGRETIEPSSARGHHSSRMSRDGSTASARQAGKSWRREDGRSKPPGVRLPVSALKLTCCRQAWCRTARRRRLSNERLLPTCRSSPSRALVFHSFCGKPCGRRGSGRHLTPVPTLCTVMQRSFPALQPHGSLLSLMRAQDASQVRQPDARTTAGPRGSRLCDGWPTHRRPAP